MKIKKKLYYFSSVIALCQFGHWKLVWGYLEKYYRYELHMLWVLKEPSHWDRSFEYPQHMFWLRNKKISFSIHTFNLSPEIDLCLINEYHPYRQAKGFGHIVSWTFLVSLSAIKRNAGYQGWNSYNACQNSKQGRPWSDCFFRSSLIGVYIVYYAFFSGTLRAHNFRMPTLDLCWAKHCTWLVNRCRFMLSIFTGEIDLSISTSKTLTTH